MKKTYKYAVSLLTALMMVSSPLLGMVNIVSANDDVEVTEETEATETEATETEVPVDETEVPEEEVVVTEEDTATPEDGAEVIEDELRDSEEESEYDADRSYYYYYSDKYEYRYSDDNGGYWLDLVSDNGDGRVTCPSTIYGTPVVVFDVGTFDINAIDVTGNSNLKKLIMAFCENITYVNLSYNYNLEYLDAHGSSLSSVNFGNNPYLNFLNFDDTYVDVDNLNLSNPAALKGLLCRYMGLTSLDVSIYPNLEQLYCNDNNIPSIDLTNNRILLSAFLNGESFGTERNSAVMAMERMVGYLCYDPTTTFVTGQNSMFRLYNPNSGEHFYTRTQTERSNLVIAGWRYEGVAWIAPTSGNPVYRVYNPYTGDHHYTMNYSEVTVLVNNGWRYEGVCWYSSGSTPIYRLYNPNCRGAGSHHYTRNVSERNSLMNAGWRYEGIGWYAV